MCALIAERAIPPIYGNHDYTIGRDLEDCGCAYVDQHDRELSQQSVEWTLARTDKRSKALMRELPFDLRFTAGSRSVNLVHASPREGQRVPVRGQACASVRASRCRRAGRRARLRHTHRPWMREHGGVLFVSCGSVGKRNDGYPSGAFAVLDATSGELRVSIEPVANDAQAVAAAVGAAGLPGECADKLLVAA